MSELYPVPTTRYAGAFIVELDPTIDWSEVDGVILASDGSAWLDYTRLPAGTGTENRVISYEISDSADMPVRTLRATLHMRTAAGSLSSGAVESPYNTLSGSFSPAIFGKRRIIVQDPLGDPDSLDPTDWVPRFWGQIDDHLASSSGNLEIFARDLSSRLMVPYTGDPVWIGTEGQLVPLDEAVQRVIDARFGAGRWALRSPNPDLEWAIPAFELSESDNILQTVRDMAQQRGAVVRWWPDPSTGRFQLTIFVLQEDKVDPDYTYSASQTEDIPAHGSDTTNYRNDFTLRFVDGDTNEVVELRRPATPEEIAAFDLQPLLIGLGSTDLIRTEEEAKVMLDSVETALRVPATVGRRRLPRNPGIEVNSLLRLNPDGRVLQEDADLYVVGWTERVAISGERFESYTTVDLRGAPVGQIGAWLRSFSRQERQWVYPDSYEELIDFRMIRRTVDSVTYGWKWGGMVQAVIVQAPLIQQPVTSDHWPAEDGPYDALLTDRVNEVEYTFPIPGPGFAQLGQFVPVLRNGSSGPLRRVTIFPTGTEPDIITALVPLVDDDDGSVSIRVEVVDRTQSIRYAYAVGQNPSWPTDEEVEAGAVLALTGEGTINLPAETVGWNEKIRVRAAPYVNIDGTGTDGTAEDHGQIRAAEDIRLAPPVSLEETTVSEDGSTGTFGVTVRDPAGKAVALYSKTKAGEAEWTDWVLETSNPVDGQEYTANVALIERHQSAIKFRLEYKLHGATGWVESVSPSFDKGAIPNVVIGPRIDEDGAVSAVVVGDSDTFGLKIAASTTATPSESDVRAESLIVGRTFSTDDIGTLLTAEPGDTVYFAAFGYGPNGEESTTLAIAEATYHTATPPPSLYVYTESESGSTGSFGVRVQNPGGLEVDLYYRTKSGTGSWSSWTLKQASAVEGVTYSETVTLVEKHLSYIEFRLDYEFAGDSQSIHLKSSGFDRGRVPNVTCVPSIDSSGVVYPTFTGDFDTASIKYATSTAGQPTATTVRSVGAVNARNYTGGGHGPLNQGQTLYISWFGYSETNGNGNEQTELGQTRITRGVDPQPKIQVSGTRVGTTATVVVTVDDPALKVTAIQYRIRSGSSISSWSSSWSSSSGTIGANTSLSRTLNQTVQDGTDIEIEWRVTFDDQNGNSKSVGDSIPVSNLRELTKRIRVPYSSFQASSGSDGWVAIPDSIYGYLQPNVTNSVREFSTSIVLPQGVELAYVRTHVYREPGVANVSARMRAFRVPDGGSPQPLITELYASHTGWGTLQRGVSHTIEDDEIYTVVVDLTSRNHPSDARLRWAELEYVVPDYSKTY